MGVSSQAPVARAARAANPTAMNASTPAAARRLPPPPAPVLTARPMLRPREEAGQDGLHADAGKPHRHLHVGARALPGAHLAHAERRMPQLRADLQAARLILVVFDADLAGRTAAPGRGGGRAPRRRHRQARARRLVGVVAVPRPASAPGTAPLAVA